MFSLFSTVWSCFPQTYATQSKLMKKAIVGPVDYFIISSTSYCPKEGSYNIDKEVKSANIP